MPLKPCSSQTRLRPRPVCLFDENGRRGFRRGRGTPRTIYCLELVQKGRIRLVEEPLTGYRQHAASQSADPTVWIRWHETIETWLAQNADALPENALEHARTVRLHQLSSLAWRLKAERQWSEYWCVRDFLRSYEGNESVDLVLNNRIYPSWIYGLADLLGDRLGRWRSRVGA